MERISAMLQRLLPHYARSDQLAISYQKWRLRAATWLYRLAASQLLLLCCKRSSCPMQRA